MDLNGVPVGLFGPNLVQTDTPELRTILETNKENIEDAYGGSSPHPLQTVRKTSKFCPKIIEILTFFDDFGAPGAPRADLDKKVEKCTNKVPGDICF